MLAGQGGMSQSILVTGGAGYVGSHACKALADAGYRPVVYDNLSRGHREAAVGTMVFSSTCAVYGTPDRVPIGETTAKAPLNPYGETKLAIERALHWYAAG